MLRLYDAAPGGNPSSITIDVVDATHETQKDYRRAALRSIAALLAIAAVTFICYALITVNATTVGFIYLVTILVIAAEWGLRESVIASVAGVLCFNFFFFSPVGTFTIADPQNWVALFAFLVISLIASQLSARAKRRTIEVISRKEEIERLYDLSRAILLTDTNQPIAKQISKEIARIYHIPSVVIYDRAEQEMHQAGPEQLDGIEQVLQDAAMQGSALRQDETLVTPISLGGRPIGGLALKGARLSDTALQALSNLVAIALEKARAQELANRAEAARQSQEFKSLLLDALAHEFKTPLTSVKAATSAILSSEVAKPEEQHDLLTIIDQETDRLSALVTETIQLAQIEAGKIELTKQPCSVRALINGTLRQMDSMLEGRALEISALEDLPPVLVDVDLMQMLFRQLIDNAVKYSPPGSPIRVTAKSSHDEVIISIRNDGEGLSPIERSRIFERFYRGVNVRHRVPGTGMGLAIAREILLAHGGDITVESNSEEGIKFFVSLPVAKEIEKALPQGREDRESTK